MEKISTLAWNDQGCQMLATKQMPNHILRKANFQRDFTYYINFYRLLKKANYLINSHKFWWRPFNNKGKILLFLASKRPTWQPWIWRTHLRHLPITDPLLPPPPPLLTPPPPCWPAGWWWGGPPPSPLLSTVSSPHLEEGRGSQWAGLTH